MGCHVKTGRTLVSNLRISFFLPLIAPQMASPFRGRLNRGCSQHPFALCRQSFFRRVKQSLGWCEYFRGSEGRDNARTPHLMGERDITLTGPVEPFCTVSGGCYFGYLQSCPLRAWGRADPACRRIVILLVSPAGRRSAWNLEALPHEVLPPKRNNYWGRGNKSPQG